MLGLEAPPDDAEIRRKELERILGLAPQQMQPGPAPNVPPPPPMGIPDLPAKPDLPPADPADMGAQDVQQKLDSGMPPEPNSSMAKPVSQQVPPPEPVEADAEIAKTAESPSRLPPTLEPAPAEEQQQNRSPQMSKLAEQATAPPPPTVGKASGVAMGPLRNQGSATQEAMDLAKSMVTQTNPKTGQPEYKRPAVWKSILQPLVPRFDLSPNITQQYRNLALLSGRAEEERKLQVAQGTEETRRLQAEAARARANRDNAAARNPTQWGLLQDAANNPDPAVQERAAKTLKLKEESDVRASGSKAGASATGRLDALRNAPAYTIKPNSPEWRVSQDLAYGKIDFADLQKLYSYNRDSGLKVALYDQARQFNPNFSPKDFEAGFKIASNPKIVSQLSSLDNVVMGVPDLLNASDMASRTGVTVLNNIINKGGYMIGGRHYTDFRTARSAFADELSGALGYGSATDMSREMGFDMTDPNMSPDNFQSSVENILVPFIQRKRYSITKTMGPYSDRVTAPAYTPHVPASAAPPPAPAPPAPPAEATNPALRTGPSPAPASGPATSNQTGQYIVGGIYGGKTYRGPDPNLATSWR